MKYKLCLRFNISCMIKLNDPTLLKDPQNDISYVKKIQTTTFVNSIFETFTVDIVRKNPMIIIMIITYDIKYKSKFISFIYVKRIFKAQHIKL